MSTTNVAQQVFAVNELLEMIIWEVPPHCTHDLKLISGAWRDMIAGSKTIHNSRLLLLENAGDQWTEEDSRIFETTHEMPEPCRAHAVLCAILDDCPPHCYPSTSWPRVNPRLQVHDQTPTGGDYPTRRVNILLPDALDENTECLEQMITDPPICALTLVTMFWDADHGEENAASAYKRDGLKIKDMITVKHLLIEAQKKYPREVGALNISIGAAFDVEIPLPCKDVRLRGGTQVKVVLAGGDADLTYFEGPLPRYRRMNNSSQAELKAAMANDLGLD
ncbi:hypothetical protein DOTSEDRAFT_29846 [Dothistroma septosporum NZE10]|uniref:Uncharacterized protein n=1 Tax=Dothistroma septosporum (strain NZE10 / CBS 128990) TaxID=675120 RepID=N1PY79_DOTSN|nr:hypothetical protein DOTSEDRAFT_29846 [Dothistroma septosporum NZE10]